MSVWPEYEQTAGVFKVDLLGARLSSGYVTRRPLQNKLILSETNIQSWQDPPIYHTISSSLA